MSDEYLKRRVAKLERALEIIALAPPIDGYDYDPTPLQDLAFRALATDLPDTNEPVPQGL